MEPPLFTADNRATLYDAVPSRDASMEPPLFTADNFPIPLGAISMMPSFNGAAVIHGG